MRFEFAIAAKYLVPRIKQLSVSIISLLSILVISLVVWLILVFLSVTDGLEKSWIDKLVSLNAPMRLNPTEAYYQSFYYQIDSLSENSSYRTKSIQEKLSSKITNPYDEDFDPEIPESFGLADYNSDGTLKDIVKETFEAIHSMKDSSNLVAHDYEVGLGQYKLQLLRQKQELTSNDAFITDTAYIASIPETSKCFNSTCIEPSGSDLQNVLAELPRTNFSIQEDIPGIESYENDEKRRERFLTFFENVRVSSLKTAKGGFLLPQELLPTKVRYSGIALLQSDEVVRFIIPKDEASKNFLQKKLKEHGYQTVSGALRIKVDQWSFIDDKKHVKKINGVIPIVLDEEIFLNATLDAASLSTAKNIDDIYFHICTDLQNKTIRGRTHLSSQLELGAIQPKTSFKNEPQHKPYWLYKVENENLFRLPSDPDMGEGVLVAKGFKDNGVLIGDKGFLSYQAASASAIQEQRIPIFVAGFYDPGIIPLSGKIILARPEIAATIRSAASTQSNTFGNGIQVWFDNLDKASLIKANLERKLAEKGLTPYWKIETYQEYEFSKDLVQQLKSDKNLFSLLAIIIIVVACSNIISMLILLVNDKKKEIGILQSMGASPWNIALIFGTCGMILGLVSSLIGTFAAYITLHHIDTLVNLLSSLQGFDAFNAAFYGDALPNQMSSNALTMVWIATSIISLLAGLIPAIKASLLKPTLVLRSE
ncbi:MAG: FtsX-like permease family protein [Chlamydiales bacterium]|nr:FtsX-like permease family protein [Chlamydiales bacterium]